MAEEIRVINELIESIKGVSVPYIKLLKGTKHYNWEFKIIGNDLKKVIELNNKFLEEFGDMI